MANTDTLWDAIQAELAARVDVLLRRSYSELASVPAAQSIPLRHNGVETTFITYRDLLANGAIQIIVHAHTPQRMNLLSKADMVLARGFRVTHDGRVQEVPDRDLYEYRPRLTSASS